MQRELAGRIRAIVAREEQRLRAIPPESAARPGAPGKWSPSQVLGHLIDSAANNHQRFVRCQIQGHLVISGYTQGEWVATQAYHEEPWGDLIGLWTAFNAHLAHVVQHMPDAALSHTCAIIAVDGQPGPAISLEALVVDYLRHLEHHLQQIRPEGKKEDK